MNHGKCRVGCPKVKRKVVKEKDTEDLLTELMLLAGDRDMAVYDIHIRKAGFGIGYALYAGAGGDIRRAVFQYYPSLRRAVIGEIERMNAGYRVL